MRRLPLLVLVSCALCVTLPARAASVTPVFLPGAREVTCADVQGPGQSWTEYRTYPEGDGVYLPTEGPILFGNFSGSTFDWTATTAMDAVIVKGAVAGTNAYVYQGATGGQEARHDEQLTTPAGAAIEYVSFCYDADPLTPLRSTRVTGGADQDVYNQWCDCMVQAIWSVEVSRIETAAGPVVTGDAYIQKLFGGFFLVEAIHVKVTRARIAPAPEDPTRRAIYLSGVAYNGMTLSWAGCVDIEIHDLVDGLPYADPNGDVHGDLAAFEAVNDPTTEACDGNAPNLQMGAAFRVEDVPVA